MSHSIIGQHICITIKNYFKGLFEKQAMMLLFLSRGWGKASPETHSQNFPKKPSVFPGTSS